MRDLVSKSSALAETRNFRYNSSRRSYLAERVWPQMAYVSRSPSGDSLESWSDFAKKCVWEGRNLAFWILSGPIVCDPSGWIRIDVRTPKTLFFTYLGHLGVSSGISSYDFLSIIGGFPLGSLLAPIGPYWPQYAPVLRDSFVFRS